MTGCKHMLSYAVCITLTYMNFRLGEISVCFIFFPLQLINDAVGMQNFKMGYCAKFRDGVHIAWAIFPGRSALVELEQAF